MKVVKAMQYFLQYHLAKIEETEESIISMKDFIEAQNDKLLKIESSRIKEQKKLEELSAKSSRYDKEIEHYKSIMATLGTKEHDVSQSHLSRVQAQGGAFESEGRSGMIPDHEINQDNVASSTFGSGPFLSRKK